MATFLVNAGTLELTCGESAAPVEAADELEAREIYKETMPEGWVIFSVKQDFGEGYDPSEPTPETEPASE